MRQFIHIGAVHLLPRSHGCRRQFIFQAAACACLTVLWLTATLHAACGWQPDAACSFAFSKLSAEFQWRSWCATWWCRLRQLNPHSSTLHPGSTPQASIQQTTGQEHAHIHQLLQDPCHPAPPTHTNTPAGSMPLGASSVHGARCTSTPPTILTAVEAVTAAVEAVTAHGWLLLLLLGLGLLL